MLTTNSPRLAPYCVSLLSTALVLAMRSDALAAPPPSPPNVVDSSIHETTSPATSTTPTSETEVNPVIRDERGDPVLGYTDPAADEQLDLPRAEPKAATEIPRYKSPLNPPEQDLPRAQRASRPAPPPEHLDAQYEVSQARAGHRSYAQTSRKRFAVELKFGPYLPQIDSRFDGEGFGPYATIYGNTDGNGIATSAPKHGLFSVLGFEWAPLHFGGPLSIGMTVGLFRDNANSLYADVPTSELSETESIRSAADQTAFNLVPITVLIGYRFEYLADHAHIPLVPYARAGLAYGAWWTTSGDGNISVNAAGEKGRGGTFGWQANLGGMLRLDFIEPDSSKDLDRTSGINHTYIFGEYQFSRINGFGSDTRMNVGADTWMAGVAMEF